MPVVPLESIARFMLVVLLNGLWQGALIAGVTWAALRLSPRVNASTRYAAWTLALAATLILPLVTSVTRISYQDAPHAATSANETSMQSVRIPRSDARTTHHTPAAPAAASAEHLSLPQAPNVTVAPPAVLTSALFALWALAAVALLVRLAVALFALERLKRDALPLGMEYRERLQQWQSASGTDRDVRICVTEGIEVPVAVGLFDAMVLLPHHLLDALDPNEIDQISLHELAHLLRHDDWSNSFQRLVTALLFFNPAVWFIARQMDIEREVACDDYVLELTGAVRNYAYCLTKMAEMTSWPHQPLAAPGVFVTRKNISIRIERLLRTGRAISSAISPATACAVVAGLAVAYVVMRAMTPIVAFALPMPQEDAPIVASKGTPAPHVTLQPKKKAAPAETAEPVHPHIFPSPEAATRVAVTVPEVNVPGVDVHVAPISVPGVDVHIKPIHIPAHTVIAEATGLRYGCTGCDFAHAQLRGKDFTHVNLTGANFADADLEGARFDGSTLSGADFSHANLADASFVNANMSGCDLAHANLRGANFDGAKLDGCDIDVKDLSPSQTRWFLNACTGCDFSNANLSGQDLHGVKVTGVDLSGASFRNANLSGASFTGIDFSHVDFSGANLDNTTFSGCEFDGADLRNVDLTHTNFVGSSLGSAIMNR
jgi:uncharacterized protein YjbI with pentapeptide repeats/beta-lactamase regulating signal transducer with metallopeptidase domain